MKTNSGVLFIQSEPGTAKSAISRSIAKKMGYVYQDLRLSQIDETDLSFPTISEVKCEVKGEMITVKCVEHAVPAWAVKANSRPTIIHFEELNRAQLAVRNAALQILLERTIGAEFKFNDDVLFISSGNNGEEDGCDVESFDNALNNRLVHFQHTLILKDWIANFAGANVHPMIVKFLNSHANFFYKKPNLEDKCKAYATARSWTYLSDYIFHNFGELDENLQPIKKVDEAKNVITNAPKVESWINQIKVVSHSFVGQSSVKFLQWCEDMLKITVKDVMDRYQDIKADLDNFNRDKKSEILGDLKDKKMTAFTEKQVRNVTDFLTSVSEDECINYLLHVVYNEMDYQVENSEKTDQNQYKILAFLKQKEFKKYIKRINDHIDKKE